MSTAAEEFGRAANAIFQRLGEGAVYTYVDSGATTTLTAVKAQRLKEQVEGYGAAVAETTETISVLYAYLVRDPRRLDTITITSTGTVYTVQHVIHNDGYVVTVAVI